MLVACGHRRWTSAAGTALAITGPNGAGKSTLALTLAGLLTPRGRSRARGAATGAPGPATNRSAGSRGSCSPASARCSRTRSTSSWPRRCAANWRRAAARSGCRSAEIAAGWTTLLQRLRLDHLAEANPFTLSGGEKRRLSVATVLATRPGVLVLDEPTFGQDFRTWREIVALLAELVDEGTAVVAVSHDAEFVSALADDEFRLAGAWTAAPTGW